MNEGFPKLRTEEQGVQGASRILRTSILKR